MLKQENTNLNKTVSLVKLSKSQVAEYETNATASKLETKALELRVKQLEEKLQIVQEDRDKKLELLEEYQEQLRELELSSDFREDMSQLGHDTRVEFSGSTLARSAPSFGHSEHLEEELRKSIHDEVHHHLCASTTSYIDAGGSASSECRRTRYHFKSGCRE